MATRGKAAGQEGSHCCGGQEGPADLRGTVRAGGFQGVWQEGKNTEEHREKDTIRRPPSHLGCSWS